MTPSEYAATLDSRVASFLSTARTRARSAVSAIQVRLTTSLSTVRAPFTATESSPADSGPADQPTAPPTPESDPSPDDDAADTAPFPVLSEETGRDINDLLLERGVTREEYVREILEAHDGRLRQQRIKQYTDWSAASVSRLLGRMEDAGTITRFRIGNEKVVCVPDADPRTDVFETEIAVSH